MISFYNISGSWNADGVNYLFHYMHHQHFVHYHFAGFSLKCKPYATPNHRRLIRKVSLIGDICSDTTSSFSVVIPAV
jgi:hypothetical protein